MKGITLWTLLCVLVAAQVGGHTANAKGHREFAGRTYAVWCGPTSPIIGDCAVFLIPALVQVYSQDGELLTEVMTDAAGNFVVADLKPGTYSLVVSAAVPPPLYFLRYIPVTQTITVHKKNDVPTDFFLWLLP